MRLRPRTIRTQLITLLLVPMVSLLALWTYGSYTTLRGALGLTRVNITDHYYGVPAEALTEALQNERLAAVEYDVTNGRSGGPELRAAEKTTDASAGELRQHLQARAAGSTLNADQNARVGDILSALQTIPGLRASVLAGDINWFDILNAYSLVIDPDFRLQSALTEQQSGEVARKGAVVVELDRARELLSQEDALVLGGHLGDGMSDPQYNELIGDIDGRELIDNVYAPELPPSDARKLQDFENGNVGWSLLSQETSARAASALTVQEAIPADQWRQNVEVALRQLAAIDQDAALQVDEAAHTSGMSVLNKAAVALLIGLLAVVISLIVSVRIGRRIALRLTALRDNAEYLSGHRLPEIMRRLREGDSIDDAETASWPRTASDDLFGTPGGADLGADFGEEFGDDEIGQVGRAFGVAQRTAVQAAVEQARLRRGVAAVFTTLARRSQVILHRQLALLDTMERRARDPGELADLFRLDHMTNRMRRQAEGLLILSGLTPGRAWRRPVRMGEVVRAAVGEVEGYERIAVRRMPGVALVGGAVADVLHLLAELMENATNFSPPDSEVVVRGEEVAAGFAVEIEDRGLGMNPDRLAEANRAIRDSADRAYVSDGGTAVIDLPETDRLGLYTVGRLSARHGVRVTLGRTSRGGTVAVVFIPAVLLAVPEEGERCEEPPDTAIAAVPAGRGQHRAVRAVTDSTRTSAAGGSVAGSGTGGARRAASDGGTGGDGTGDGGDVNPLPRRPRPSETADRTTSAGLPRRVPSSSRASRLREESVAHERPAGGSQDRSDRERSPEEARSVIAAYARGLARGRSDSAETRDREPGRPAADGASEDAVDKKEQGETATQNAIEKAVARENARQEDGGPTS
jgi:hypothetical protein